MAENESFFRKVVRFVANPATDWNDLSSRQDDTRELDLEKSELKAMIERKRRNDFVRKREFDTLRRVRREGLSADQMAALGGSSRLDDSDVRMPPDTAHARSELGVKAKIDEIEQQMVGDGFTSTRGARGSGFGTAGGPSTGAARLGEGGQRPPARPMSVPAPRPDATTVADATLRARASVAGHLTTVKATLPMGAMEGAAPGEVSPARAIPPAPVQMARGLPPLAPAGDVAAFELIAPAPSPAQAHAFASASAAPAMPAVSQGDPDAPAAAPLAADAVAQGVEVAEVALDPELDEAVIAFANADFGQCEDALRQLTGASGPRAHHAETWLVLFDLYRATGQQPPFEGLALEFAQRFGWSAPQWYSLPRLVAEAQADEPPLSGAAPTRSQGDVGWVCPPLLEVESVSRLRSQTLQMPLPWVLDWGQLQRIEAEAAMQLSTLFRLWAGQALEMQWVDGDRLFAVLQEAAPTGVRDADPAFWLTRLDALRLCNRADQFDEAAIDYCVTYEVSPPSWEPARCKVRISGASLHTRPPSLSVISEVSTSFMETGDASDGGIEVAHVELSGQLVGDIGSTLDRLNGQLGAAPVVSVSCARLIRVDFIAAGDLLNWVLAKRNEARVVQFYDLHRLVALFFGAMGINEHARVQVRRV
jgi:hypothetical protein